PRLIGDLLGSVVWQLGQQQAADQKAAALAAEAAKAAMPTPELAPEPTAEAAQFTPDRVSQQRINRAVRNAPRCRICRKPMVTGSYDWSGGPDADPHP